MLEGSRVRALLPAADGRIHGVATDDGRTIAARAVILASGGAAALWRRTTNPPGSYGSGLMLARAAGAELADLEFVQFHPTAVVGVKGREGFLVTEAIRGEGATLHDAAGERFVDELEPRDAVAKAIHRLLVETGAPAVYLDMTAIDPARFPNVVDALREAGVDPATERIPVSPASHYVMGGITTDLDGRSTVAGLYAVGEARAPACTARTGWPRTRSASASSSGAGPRSRGSTIPPPPVPSRPRRRRTWPPPRAARPATRCGARRGWSGPPTACAGCSRTRIRWRGSSPRRRSPARRAAAPMRAPSSRSRTPRSTSTTASCRRPARRRRTCDGHERTQVNLNST